MSKSGRGENWCSFLLSLPRESPFQIERQRYLPNSKLVPTAKNQQGKEREREKVRTSSLVFFLSQLSPFCKCTRKKKTGGGGERKRIWDGHPPPAALVFLSRSDVSSLSSLHLSLSPLLFTRKQYQPWAHCSPFPLHPPFPSTTHNFLLHQLRPNPAAAAAAAAPQQPPRRKWRGTKEEGGGRGSIYLSMGLWRCGRVCTHTPHKTARGGVFPPSFHRERLHLCRRFPISEGKECRTNVFGLFLARKIGHHARPGSAY